MTFGKNNNQKGFALLFAVLMSSLLLTVGLSIFSIALKELSISTSGRQSQYAFYAADSGRECALYWDKKAGGVPTLDGGEGVSGMLCNGQVFIAPENRETYIDFGSISNESGKISLSDNSVADFTSPWFNVAITKCWKNVGSVSCDTTQATNRILTTIQSFGHDLDNDNKLERAIKQTYY